MLKKKNPDQFPFKTVRRAPETNGFTPGTCFVEFITVTMLYNTRKTETQNLFGSIFSQHSTGEQHLNVESLFVYELHFMH